MKLRTSLITPIVNAQIAHIKIADHSFLQNNKNYLRKVVCHGGKILADNEHCWGWGGNSISGIKDRVVLDPRIAVQILVLMLTESAKEFKMDSGLIVSEIDKVQDCSKGFIETVERLIQSSINQYADYQSYFGLLTYAGLTEATLYAELNAHFALTKFRVQKGYMGVRAGNYIHENESIGWNDAQCAKEYAYGAGLGTNAIELIMEGLEKTYKNVIKDRVDRYTNIYPSNLPC